MKPKLVVVALVSTILAGCSGSMAPTTPTDPYLPAVTSVAVTSSPAVSQFHSSLLERKPN